MSQNRQGTESQGGKYVHLDKAAVTLIRQIAKYRQEDEQAAAGEEAEPVKEKTIAEVIAMALAEYMTAHNYIDRWRKEINEQQEQIIALLNAQISENDKNLHKK